MDTKWKKSRAVGGFLAFVLGVSLALEGLLFFGANLSSASGRQWMADSFQSDWRDTQELRAYAAGCLETLITMGAGGAVGGSYYGSYAFGGYGWASTDGNSAEKADYLHTRMSRDKNILYSVRSGGVTKYTNDTSLTYSTIPAGLPEGYGLLLQFDGAKVRIWKDGQALDVYGDGWYDYDGTGQWYVPGYENFSLGEAAADVQVTMAVIDEPRVFITGTEQYDQLYYLKRNLEEFRADILTRLAWLCAGAALIALSVPLRKDKARADRFLARGTGKVWFEGKLILFLALLVCLLPRTGYLTEVWRELSCAYGASSTAAAAVTEWGEVIYDSGVTQVDGGAALNAVADNAGWILRAYLSELAQYPGRLLVIFWGFCLLIVNDWRYNPKTWRHGLLGMLSARDLKQPIQKRLSRSAGLTALAFGALALEAAYLFSALLFNCGWSAPLWWYAAVLAPCGAALALLAWTLARQTRLWKDLGALTDHIANLRGGALEQPLLLPPDHDLAQTADDVNHIQQGLHQAVEERTRSERMKVELVTNVSHDLKTPLTSILSYTELLAQEPLEPPASEYVRILGEKAQRLRAMVQDVFEVSKAASGQLPVKLERLDFARLLRQTLADLDGAIRDSGLTLRAAIPEEEIPITADSDRLYRVFQNLIGNALKYSLPGSRIYLTLAAAGGRAEASIKNTSAAELKPGADYTARFVRGDESRTDGGSGLGLSIADSFTRACGGTLTVATEADLFAVTVRFPTPEKT